MVLAKEEKKIDKVGESAWQFFQGYCVWTVSGQRQCFAWVVLSLNRS